MTSALGAARTKLTNSSPKTPANSINLRLNSGPCASRNSSHEPKLARVTVDSLPLPQRMPCHALVRRHPVDLATIAVPHRDQDTSRRRFAQRIFDRFRHPISVHIERDRRLRVPEPSRHLHHRHTGLQPRHRCTVSQIVQSHTLASWPRWFDCAVTARTRGPCRSRHR